MASADEPATPHDGVRHLPALNLPLSPFLSPQAVADACNAMAAGDPVGRMDNATVLRELPRLRRETEAWAKTVVDGLRARHAVDITPERWNGVPVLRVPPRDATAAQRARLPIELHGGGFVMSSAASLGLMEAIPVAAMTGMIAIDYRQGRSIAFLRPARMSRRFIGRRSSTTRRSAWACSAVRPVACRPARRWRGWPRSSCRCQRRPGCSAPVAMHVTAATRAMWWRPSTMRRRLGTVRASRAAGTMAL